MTDLQQLAAKDCRGAYVAEYCFGNGTNDIEHYLFATRLPAQWQVPLVQHKGRFITRPTGKRLLRI